MLLVCEAYRQIPEPTGWNRFSSARDIRQTVQRFLEAHDSQTSLSRDMAGKEETQEKQ